MHSSAEERPNEHEEERLQAPGIAHHRTTSPFAYKVKGIVVLPVGTRS